MTSDRAVSAGALDIVVNFYCGAASDRSTRELLACSTEVSLRLLRRNPVVRQTVLVDGSASPCREMEAVCERLEVGYLHDGRELNFVEGYNLGWRSVDGEFVGLMANDIVPMPIESMETLLEWVAKPDVGGVFPYMISNRAAWDETQRPTFVHRGRLSCEPASMT
ncbi:MAG: hypothetical protein R3244_01230, partial [Thermoanaerobaculia bacterium]|nr:hypothetical protein [Thermoanaerobaculia bacterium]